MTALGPTRYSEEASSTFFEVAGSLVSVRYELTHEKHYLVLPGPSLATIEVSIDDGTSVLVHQYEITKSRKIGEEIAAVEQRVYGFLDEVVRTAMQIRAMETTQKEVEALEEEHLYEQGSQLRTRRPASAAGAAAESGVLNELCRRLITAVRHVTKLTSLTAEGLRTYQNERNVALDRIVQSTSPVAAMRVQDLLGAVEAYLDYEIEGTDDLGILKAKTLDYLALIIHRETDKTPVVTAEQARVIANEFVPAYVGLRQNHKAAVRFPRDVAGHAFGSFFGGGIAGFFTLSLFGEAVIRGLTGMSLDIPGFWIGAAVAFVGPYAQALYGMLTRDKQYEKKRGALLSRVSRRLNIDWPGATPPPGS